jgi:hypothetical protein
MLRAIPLSSRSTRPSFASGVQRPARFRKEPLQTLCLFRLSPHKWLSVGKGDQALITLGRRQESFKAAKKRFLLSVSSAEIVVAYGNLRADSVGGDAQSFGQVAAGDVNGDKRPDIYVMRAGTGATGANAPDRVYLKFVSGYRGRAQRYFGNGAKG